MILIHLDGLQNVRDLGGYAAADGRRIKSGLIFRGDRLDNLTEQGRKQFLALGVKNVFDLRDFYQAGKYPDPQLAGVNIRVTPAEIYSDEEHVLMMTEIPSLTEDQLSWFIARHKSHYINMITAPSALKAVFDSLLSGGAPIYFHCTAGKDRTGVVAALIMETLGVPHETVVADYMLSLKYRRASALKAVDEMFGGWPKGLPGELAKCYLCVDESWLQGTFDTVEKLYGSAEEFVARGLGFGDDGVRRLRSLYLEG